MYVLSAHKRNMKSHDCVYKLLEKEKHIEQTKEKKQKSSLRET